MTPDQDTRLVRTLERHIVVQLLLEVLAHVVVACVWTLLYVVLPVLTLLVLAGHALQLAAWFGLISLS
jgi:hypothetical protein